MSDSALVWWILVPLFAVVGLYLIWYARRRKKMFEKFARSNQLRLRPEQRTALLRILDRCFKSEAENTVRTFDQISSPVDGGSVWLFRVVELVDLNPHAQSYSTHFPRIAALFPVQESYKEWFLLDKSLQPKQKLPGAGPPGAEVVEITRRIATSCRARHLLSITLSGGHGLIYFEPLVTGGETIEDMNCLYCIAREMQRQLKGEL